MREHPASDHLELRNPETVMRLARLGSFHQCRLSFMRQLTRRFAHEAWTVSRTVFDIDHNGVGRAVYQVDTGVRQYALVAFGHDLPDALRSDRVIAEQWDATFTLFDGIPTTADLDRLADNVPLQEAGRVSGSELTLSRANRSARLWDYVVEKLAAGQQPDPARLEDTGYLMRTTAVYGSGKFGAQDRVGIEDRTEFDAPFQAEMLTVYLIRTFVRDLINHMASARGGATSVQLDPELAQGLGIGNSTGLGMAPFLINHPRLLNNWIAARETAIGRVRALKTASMAEHAQFRAIFARFQNSVATWHSAHSVQQEKLTALTQDLTLCQTYLDETPPDTAYPWAQLMEFAQNALSFEGQEAVASLILEPYGDLIDDLAMEMSVPSDPPRLDGTQSVAAVRAAMTRHYGWALQTDWTSETATARVWYVSAEKLEPRLGERAEEPIEPYEQPLAPARDIARAFADIEPWDADETIAAFLLKFPEHRQAVRRVLTCDTAPFAEIRDNTISATMMPIDMLRCKLSFFGATKFDPRSDRWVRICMFSGAPYPDEMTPTSCDLWVYPATGE
jgi:hypothetical protein